MSTIRQNLMTRAGYTPYCGGAYDTTTCSMPRTNFDGEQFVCPECGWRSSFDEAFIKEYKKKWNIK